MGSGRKPHGRPSHLNGRSTRAVARILAFQAPGAGSWRRRHDRKALHPLYCEALKAERAMHRGQLVGMLLSRGPRHMIYACQYGDHWLIEAGTRHWHVGRPSDKL